MNFLKPLKEEYQSYNSHGRPILKWAGIVGAVAFPLFYALHLLRATKEFDSVWLRAVMTLMCFALVLRERWPERFRPYYLGWSYATFIICLPFFSIFMALKNGGGTIGVANTFMALFFLILLTDWRNTLVMLLVGGSLALIAYFLGTTDPAIPRDYVGRWPVFVLVVIGGSVLKFSQTQVQAVRLDALTALAGSIAHEMRHPLGQVKQSLRSIGDLLPPPLTRTGEHKVLAGTLESLYRQLAAGEQAVHRGLQVVSMTLEEVTSRPLDKTSFHLISAADATSRALAEYGFEDDDPRHRVRLEVLEDFSFHGDETAYLFVLFNLLKNSLYYVSLRPDLEVKISIDRRCVTVRDSGPGIAPEVLSRLFQPFVTAAKSGGTGLGLAYCRRVMRTFGGDIECTSELRRFTQFDLRFPPLDVSQAQTHEASLIDRAIGEFGDRRILVVDDDETLRIATARKLAVTGAIFDDVGDGREALELLKKHEYSLVLLDLNMPVMDGYEFAERVRHGEVSPARDVPIVAFTSDSPSIAKVKTRKVGMDGFVCKPASRSQLLQGALDGVANASTRHQNPLAGKRILVADDSAFNRRIAAGQLRHAGALVREAANGVEVLAVLGDDVDIDAVLLDINMPGMDGIETAGAIRNMPSPANALAIIALTAHADGAMHSRALAAGMDAIVTKPVEPQTLVGTLVRLAGHKGGGRHSTPLAIPSATGTAASADELIDLRRLASLRKLGIADELVAQIIPSVGKLVEKLQRQAATDDLDACLDTLHSLMGVSGEAGALRLCRTVRNVYVPMMETRTWPPVSTWLADIAALAVQTEQALEVAIESARASG